jgi:hypothetical protein
MKPLAVAVVVLLSVLGACSSADDDPTEESSPDTTATTDGSGAAGDDTGEAPSDDDEGSGSGDGPGSGDGSGADEAAGDDEALGTASADLAADPNDPTLVPIRFEVLSLERLTGMVELRGRFTHDGASNDPAWEPFSTFEDPRLRQGQGAYSLSGASLVDAEGQQAYLTLVDSDGVCLCSTGFDRLAVPSGESVEVYADFGGVPDDLDAIDVQLPQFGTVSQVPIS